MGEDRRFDNSIGVSSSTMEKSLPDGRKWQEMADYVCNAKPMRLSVPLVPSSCMDVLSNLSEFSDISLNSQIRQNRFTLHRVKVKYQKLGSPLKSLG